ncbi:hypothetical protein NE237_008927 [Protea cynaroides]|uniref:Pentatricopeptide repeat-containing protein n=1 Tax=Protea cynaroides TaxID=273540 RepID=A0A9Q0R052_9MAGN|nr:hypothetical protein NE237_008927 [Protea cynaroides]
MIKDFCNVGRLEDACGLFKVMHSHVGVPSVVAYSALLDGFCRVGNLERVLELLGEMEKVGSNCSPNTVTYTFVIQSFSKQIRSTETLEVLDQMVAHGCPPNRVTMSTLIKGLCFDGCIKEAYKLVDKVVVNGSVCTTVCYSALLVCLLLIKNIEDEWGALNSTVEDHPIVYRFEDKELEEFIFPEHQVDAAFITINEKVTVCLAELSNEKGDIDVAVGLMKLMGLIDLYLDMLTYVEMIKGFCNVGMLEGACRLFKVMLKCD